LGHPAAEKKLVHRVESNIHRPLDVWFRDGSDERLHKVFRAVCVRDARPAAPAGAVKSWLRVGKPRPLGRGGRLDGPPPRLVVRPTA
jgi:hypothetical protein